jgi:hypothetical protein
MDAPAQYLEELRSDLALYPTWLPTDPIELGAFGTLKRGKLHVDGRLGDLGIDVIATTSETSDAPIRKSRGVRFRATSQANATSALVDASLGVTLEMERDHAWVFAARGITTVEIKNIAAVRDAVLEAQKDGRWQREWLLVTELRRVQTLNVMIARSRATRARVVAKGTVAAADVLLADDVTVQRDSDDLFTIENHAAATPLYALRKLQGFLRPGLRPIRGGGGPAQDGLELEVSPEEPFGFD